ncbi:cytochrome P450 [Nesidiocoris tenuis]|uniref:Cytochrome P450 n=1 Tax=Nesidiocoris tenuis TaxID=355587 RepID=A0ABN7AZE9_9HEMI|nr:cytochrome P450 [Nesidiocoris tenuis]
MLQGKSSPTNNNQIFLKPILKCFNVAGIVAANGPKWKEQRRFLSAFLKSAGMLKVGIKRDVMQNRILSGVNEACKMLADGNEEKPINALKVLIHTMGNVLNELLFGITYAVDDPQWRYLQELAIEGVKLIGVAGPLNFLPFLRFFPPYRNSIKYILEGKKKTHEEYKAISQRQDEGARSEKTEESLLSIFKKEMRSGKSENFNEEQMYHILADMFGAGVETSLTTLRWFLLFMAAYPKIQDEVYQELLSVMNDREDPLLNDFAQTPFTEACIAETQRIRPVVPLGIPHGTRHDTELGGYRIPQGAMILIPQFVLHTNPRAWDRPHSFDPNRFIDKNTGKMIRSHDHFMPFQCGKRVCLGDEMARMLLFLFGAGILRKFRVSLTEEYENDDDLQEMLKGENGITWAPKDHDLLFSRR